MKKKVAMTLWARSLQKIAFRIGATVIVEPKWKSVGQITYKSGRRRYFRYSSLDLNPLGASEIAKDKDYANFFMKRMGYPTVPNSKAFYSDEWAKVVGMPNQNADAAYRYAKKLGFPVIVKPNSGIQGMGVSLAHNKGEFSRAIRAIFKIDKIALVQEKVTGKDYRLLVLDGDVVSAYQRIPLNIIGDGKSTIKKLLREKQRRFSLSGRDTKINVDDPRIFEKLERQKLDFWSIPNKYEHIYLLDNANLSSGGDAVDVTLTVHQKFKDVAVRLSRDMGLRLCGVDIIVSGDILQEPNEYWILEINSSPGLDHYAQIGPVQEKIVEELYLKILQNMEKQ